jgi:hypothetical protein
MTKYRISALFLSVFFGAEAVFQVNTPWLQYAAGAIFCVTLTTACSTLFDRPSSTFHHPV